MKKIFLDVGGFNGESALAALDPRFGFDEVHCFEPVRNAAKRIEETLCDKRLRVISAGLFDRTCSLPLGMPGELGGSVYKRGVDEQVCDFIRASDWFEENVAAEDIVWIKLNCEGAELNILNDLLDTGQAAKIHEALIDLDAAEYPSLHSDAEILLSRLAYAPFSFHFPPEVQYGTVNNYGGIRQWLVLTGAAKNSFRSRISSLIYNIPLAFDRATNGYHKIRLLRALRLRPPPNLISPALRSTWSPIYQPRGPDSLH